MADFEIPAALLSAATRAIHDMDCEPDCSGRLTVEGRYGRWARAALTAALGVCQVREECQNLWPETDSCEAFGTGWFDVGPPRREGQILHRRLVLTTPAEEVPDA